MIQYIMNTIKCLMYIPGTLTMVHTSTIKDLKQQPHDNLKIIFTICRRYVMQKYKCKNGLNTLFVSDLHFNGKPHR